MWDRFLRACRREPVDCTPVWFMRQAGRYMAEYRAIRAKRTLLEICKEPELATEVTLQPVRAHGVDAAILFADILLPLEPMGAPFEFAQGEGPVVHHPIRTAADVERLRVIDPEEGLGYVLEAIRMIRGELDGKTPLIGFAGAPFTLASYLIEGGKSSTYIRTKRLMYSEPETWAQLMGKLAEVVRRYLRAQVEAGAQALQVFDSWVGALGPQDYQEHIAPHMRHILADVEKTGVPVIHFGTGTSTLLELQRDAGGTVIGVDFRLPLDEAHRRLGDGVALQGNLDPLLLLAPWEVLEPRVRDVLDRGRVAPGHIFNLGHGIVPETPPDAVKRVVDLVHEASRR
ncbi:MAG: uroporphyrinogen decarboxylase [Myxococcales bacterium]|jgi:uroporphyrinogen decarboxylase|nr:uroporphyrinogen decarboxylase [Myxococcales bacterium]